MNSMKQNNRFNNLGPCLSFNCQVLYETGINMVTRKNCQVSCMFFWVKTPSAKSVKILNVNISFSVLNIWHSMLQLASLST